MREDAGFYHTIKTEEIADEKDKEKFSGGFGWCCGNAADDQVPDAGERL